MTQEEIIKLKKFNSDPKMKEVVFNVLRDNFQKSRKVDDVNYLASKALSVEFLLDGFKDIENYAQTTLVEQRPTTQVGL